MIRNGTYAYFPFSMLVAFLICTHVDLVHATTISVRSSVLLGLDHTVSLESYITSDSHLSLSFSALIPDI